MAGDGVNFLTPIGRLVQGDCFEAQTKDGQGNPLIYTRGPKVGQPKINYFIAVAFAKNDPAWPAFRAILDSTARRDFPHLFPGGGACTNPDFAFKVIDGDGMDDNRVSNATKEGFAGHWVIRFSTSYPPKCYAAGKYQPHEQLQVVGGVNPIPKGYMVRVAGTVKGNDTTDKPGLYISHNMIEFAAVGPLITSGPSASSVFGGAGPAAGAGAPVMTAKAAGQTYAGMIASGWTDALLVEHGYMLPPAAAPAAPPPPPPAASAPPPPPPAASAPPPPPPVTPHAGILTGGPVLTAKAAGQTYAGLIASGWTDALLVEHGYMLPAVTPPPLPSGGSASPPPPAPTAAVPPPPPAGKRMLPPAGATTYEQYIAGGWTDALLVQNGYMAA